ncbi:MAG: TonB-dependent receptor plug domain-containing protein, partial [Gemmatimonadetes bacterium]|nr:TonB-dependent receptor plug domain-containing protein [Gemmatimonadota bacterium]
MVRYHGHRLRGAPLAGVLAVVLGLVLTAAPAAAQTATVSGRVMAEETGNPVEGAQVSIVGTNLGTRTDADGRFTLLNVPAGNRQLRVLLIGYAMGSVTLAVRPGQTNTANILMRASVLRLDEIVVTGTAGGARKRELGNSLTQINAADIADPPQNVNQMLQARAPGVSVMQTSGMSGSGAQIRLRGAVSVSQSNQPILYIDGVRVRSGGYRRNRPPVGFTGRSGNVEASPLDDINPDDIERIEIIKGAAASTLYGTEAAAGVIQIFTKRGSAGAPRWTVQVNQGFAKTLAFGTDENPFLNLKPCTEGTSCWDQWTQSETVGNCGDQDEMLNIHCSWLRNGRRQKYAASVGGGSERFQYFVSGTYNDYDANLPKDNETALVARGNFGFEVLDNLKIDVTSSYTNNRIANTAAGNNAHGVTLNVFRAERNYFGD